jgi:hypothetical protein
MTGPFTGLLPAELQAVNIKPATNTANTQTIPIRLRLFKADSHTENI